VAHLVPSIAIVPISFEKFSVNSVLVTLAALVLDRIPTERDPLALLFLKEESEIVNASMKWNEKDECAVATFS